jgi:hypothetical protein
MINHITKAEQKLIRELLGSYLNRGETYKLKYKQNLHYDKAGVDAWEENKKTAKSIIAKIS